MALHSTSIIISRTLFNLGIPHGIINRAAPRYLQQVTTSRHESSSAYDKAESVGKECVDAAKSAAEKAMEKSKDIGSKAKQSGEEALKDTSQKIKEALERTKEIGKEEAERVRASMNNKKDDS